MNIPVKETGLLEKKKKIGIFRVEPFMFLYIQLKQLKRFIMAHAWTRQRFLLYEPIEKC